MWSVCRDGADVDRVGVAAGFLVGFDADDDAAGQQGAQVRGYRHEHSSEAKDTASDDKSAPAAAALGYDAAGGAAEEGAQHDERHHGLGLLGGKAHVFGDQSESDIDDAQVVAKKQAADRREGHRAQDVARQLLHLLVLVHDEARRSTLGSGWRHGARAGSAYGGVAVQGTSQAAANVASWQLEI